MRSVTIVETPSHCLLYGDSYGLRKDLKQLGGTWNKDSYCWTFQMTRVQLEPHLKEITSERDDYLQYQPRKILTTEEKEGVKKEIERCKRVHIENSWPQFYPPDGWCECNKNIFLIDNGNTIITSCPYCSRSYVE